MSETVSVKIKVEDSDSFKKIEISAGDLTRIKSLACAVSQKVQSEAEKILDVASGGLL